MSFGQADNDSAFCRATLEKHRSCVSLIMKKKIRKGLNGVSCEIILKKRSAGSWLNNLVPPHLVWRVKTYCSKKVWPEGSKKRLIYNNSCKGKDLMMCEHRHRITFDVFSLFWSYFVGVYSNCPLELYKKTLIESIKQ